MDEFRFDILASAAPLLLEGLWATIYVSTFSFTLALAIGIAVGVLRTKSNFLRAVFSPYVEIFRGTPLLIQLFFIYYGLPTVGFVLDSYTAGILGLGINGGAYISEIVRGALHSVDNGQRDAAYSQGFSWSRSMIHVILPQALPVAIPTLVNSFSAVLKESSLVSVLAITELTRVSQLIYTRTFRALEVYLVAGALYFLLTSCASRLSAYMERKYRVTGRIS
jgi:polar amino acid transport system permease protein